MIRQTEKDIILGKSQIKNPEKWKGGKESMSDKRVIFESEDEFDKFFDATERVSLIIKFYEAIQYLKERQK